MKALTIAAGLAALSAIATAAASQEAMTDASTDGEITGAWTDGEGTLNLLPSGHFAAVYGDRLVVGMGTYEALDGELTVTDVDGFNPCSGPATYAYTLDGDEVTFNLVGEDACDGRKEVVDGKTWNRVELPDMDMES